MEYQYMSDWMERAIREQIHKECVHLGFKKYEYLDCRIVDSLGGVRKVMAVIKHKNVEEEGKKPYNVSVMSVLTYADWTMSSAEVMAHCTFSDNGFRQLQDCQADFIIDYLGLVQKKLRGEE